MTTHDNLSALDNNMKAHQRYFCSSKPLKYINLKINLSFMGKTYKEKNIPYLLRRVFPPSQFQT